MLLGNFMASAFYRIPNGKPLNGINNDVGRRPHCSSCGHDLKFYEYLPLLSWISTRLKCNYCGMKIPSIYTIQEVGMMLLSIVFVLLFGINMFYVFLTLLCATVLLNVCLLVIYRTVYSKGVVIMLIASLIFSGVLMYGDIS